MQGLRVLVVDDDFILNLAITENLRAVGMDVDSAYCGSAALEAIDHHRRPAALVTDIELGPGPSGFDVARYARRAYPRLPVVYISATSAVRYASEGVEGSDFIAKPCLAGAVEAALLRVIRLAAA